MPAVWQRDGGTGQRAVHGIRLVDGTSDQQAPFGAPARYREANHFMHDRRKAANDGPGPPLDVGRRRNQDGSTSSDWLLHNRRVAVQKFQRGRAGDSAGNSVRRYSSNSRLETRPGVAFEHAHHRMRQIGEVEAKTVLVGRRDSLAFPQRRGKQAIAVAI